MQRALSPILIGRERELGVLEDTLLTASRGDARVALIAGEAGMGKTRLADELISRARKIGFEVLTGACSEAELSLPYLPFVEAVGNYIARTDIATLRERLGPSARELGRLFPRLAGGDLPADAGDPAHARLRLCEGLAELLQVPAERRGLLLVLEDLHWADASTREVIDFLVRRLRTGRVMILGTYRSDEMHRKHPLLPTVQGWVRAGLGEVVEIAPLTPEGVSGMVRAIFDQERVTEEFRDFLHNRCEGNPFVLEEMLKLAMDRGDIYRTEAGWERKDLGELRLPRTVKDTILLRVERLDERQIQLLGTAAVLGQSFEASLLTAASGQATEVVEEALHAAEQQQILEEDTKPGRYRFRHALTREVIYEDLPAPKRERLHSRAAQVLRERPESATVDVVWHLMAASAFAEALPLSLDAARQATSQGADEEAVELFRRALPHIGDQRQRADVLCSLGGACSRMGDAGAAIDYLEEGIALLERLDDPIAAAGHRIMLGRSRGLAGSTDNELREYQAAARTLEPAGPSEALAMAFMRMSAAYSFNYQYDKALPMAMKALSVAEAAGADAIRIWTYDFVGLALVGSGRIDEGHTNLWRSYREALDLDLRWIAGNALHNLAALTTWLGQATAAETMRLVPMMRDLHVGTWSVTSPLLAEEMAAIFLGEFERGIVAGQRAIPLGAARGNRWVTRFAEIGLSQHYIELGRFEEAKPLLGVTRAERQRDSQEAAAVIRFGLVTGDVARAVEAARLLQDAGEAVNGLPFSVDLAVEAFIAGGAIDEAAAMTESLAKNQPWLAATPFVLRANARVELARGDVPAAAEHARAALEFFANAGYRPDEARTSLLLARVVADSDPDGAREQVQRAARVADEIGAIVIRAEAEATMAQLGGRLEPSASHRREPDAATAPGERLVTVLFADVRGYTALTTEISPADLADRVSALQRWAVTEVERHHGVLDKFAGDALMATFNVSGATVDHCLHALQVALALRDKASMLGLPLGAGIATGPAVVGRMARGANLSVLGEATNLASRLQGQTAAGEILLSEESAKRVTTWLAERGVVPQPVELSLKGIEGETNAFRLPAPAEVVSA